MSNRKRSIIAVSLAVTLLASGTGSAQDVAIPGEAGPDYISEAGRAVAGRVFGLKDQGGEIRYYAMDLSGRSRLSASLRSAFVPGWGQAFNEQKVKGVTLFLATAGSVVGSLYLANAADDSYDDYIAAGRVNGAAYDDYESERTQAFLLGTAGALLWMLSIFDAYRNAYNPILSSRAPVDIVANDGETQIVLRRRF